MDIDKNGKMDWFFDEWVYGTEMPSYKFSYSVGSTAGGKAALSGKLTQSGVTNDFVMPVPIYVDFGKGWIYLGTVQVVGNSTVDLNDIVLPAAPKRVAIAALQDVLAEKIEITKQ